MTFVETVLVMVVVALTVTAIAALIQRSSARRRRNGLLDPMDAVAVPKRASKAQLRPDTQATAAPIAGGAPPAVPVTAERNEDYYSQTEQRLEKLFGEIENGTLSLERYADLVRADLQASEQRKLDLQVQLATGALDSQGFDKAIGETDAAASALRWCLDWAERREKN